MQKALPKTVCIMIDHKAAGSYAKLRYKSQQRHLGLLRTDTPTPLLDLILSMIEKLPQDDIELLYYLQRADKSERDPDRKPGRPKKRKNL